MLYAPVKEQDGKWLEAINQNNANIQKIDEEARTKGELLHRFLYEQYADGYAVYQIIKVNKKTVRMRVCAGVGDDWVIPYWGEETAIDKSYAENKINNRDVFKEALSKFSQTTRRSGN